MTPPADSPGSPTDPPPGAALRRARWWIGPLISAVALVLVFGGAELALRVAGVGHPTTFFLPTQVDGRAVWVENPRFTWRYLPPALARAPQPVVLDRRKAPGTVRVFVLGESAAMGDPDPAFGLARVLETLLEGRFPNRKFEVVNVAVTAINSHVMRDIAAECARLEGDFWVVYAGNNEVVGPFGPASVFGARAPNLRMLRAILALKRTRLGQALDALTDRLVRRDTPATWSGMEMFLEQQLAEDDPRLESVNAHFAANLEATLAAGQRSGAHVLVGTPVSNLRDCAPFGSAHKPGLTAADLAEWERLFRVGQNHAAAGRWTEAVAAWTQARERDDRSAELWYQLGRGLLAIGQEAPAQAAFARARDLDTLRFRPDARLSATLTRVAAGREAHRVYLLDTAGYLAGKSPHGLPGRELLFEHVHFRYEGNYLLARAFAERIATLLPAANREAEGPWPSPLACAQRLVFAGWLRYRQLEAMRARLANPPFAQQSNHAERDAYLGEELAALEPATTRAAFAPQREAFEQALRAAPGDWVLLEQYGRLLAAFGDGPGASNAWTAVLRLVPHHFPVRFELGNLLNRPATAPVAERYLREAIELRPLIPDPYQSLGEVLGTQRRWADADAAFARALALRPNSVAARQGRSRALEAQGRLAEALREQEAILRMHTNHASAWGQASRLLTRLERAREAVECARTAVRLRAGDARLRVGLGDALLAAGDSEQALEAYREAVRSQPDSGEAHLALGRALLRLDRPAEATTALLEAARRQPELAESHFQLALALARLGRGEEARKRFEETLRLEPGRADARAELQRLPR